MTEWQAGQVLFDDLRLEKAIGSGAFGEVWRARQLSWDKDVAVKRVKVPDEKRIRSMEQEAIHWLEIGLHPYVTTCYYVRRHEGAPVIVLEYASEGALDYWVKDDRLLFMENAVEQIMRFSLEVAWGLACAHQTGLLHLDVKPANILIENGHAKITDFGIASRLGQDLASPGTRSFASPEQLSGEEVSGKSDVFSWAVTVFALFQHKVSWSIGIAAPEVLEDEWALGEMPLAMPEDVYHLLMACMNEDPDARPTMEEAADDLLFILQSEYPGYERPEKVIERQPLTAAEYNNRAVYMYETGDAGGAEDYFRTALETAADITVPQYNKGLYDYYAGGTSPVKLLEGILNTGPGTFSADHIAAARILMLNGDARSIEENPEIMAASPAAQAWIEDGAPGALTIQQPHTARYMQPDDREKNRVILTTGGLSAWNRNPNALPVEFTVSPQRKTLLMDNDKGAVLLGGLNSGAEPWTTCMIFRERLKLETLYFLGENAVIYILDGKYQLCDFSDPAELRFSGLPNLPELRDIGRTSIAAIESLDNVSCMMFQCVPALYVFLILDFTDGVSGAKTKVIKLGDPHAKRGYSDTVDGFFFHKRARDAIRFCADGSLLIGGERRIRPEDWGGKRRMANDPDEVMPTNNTLAPVARIFGNFGAGSTLIRHSAEYRNISSEPDIAAFEYGCLWKIAPYRFLAMAYDDTPATGGSVVLSNESEFLVARIDKGNTPPPDKAEWLMMKAVSGAVAKKRRDIIAKVTAAYESLYLSDDYNGIEAISGDLRPLVESEDENALALWQRIARDFPRGLPFMAVGCEAVRQEGEMAAIVRHPKPIFPGLPFFRTSSIGKIKFSYNHSGQAPKLVIANRMAPPHEFQPQGMCRLVVCGEGSEDGLFQMLVYGQEGDDGKLIVGRPGILIRVFDVREPGLVFERYCPALQTQEIFARWSGHILLMYLGSEGVFAIDFDDPRAHGDTLPKPVIPDIITLYDVAFMGIHADELYTGENRFRFCYEILPFPKDPFGDARYRDIEPMLPRKPEARREMLLRNGFGELWTERILRGPRRGEQC